MRVDGDTISFTMQLDDEGRGSVIRGLFGAFRGNDMPGPDEVDRFYVKIRKAMDTGELPTEGSFLPHIKYTLDAALHGADDATLPNSYTAAIFGLAKACGARDFALGVGRLVRDRLDAFGQWKTDCSNVTFAGRFDSRRHFITAAAVQAAVIVVLRCRSESSKSSMIRSPGRAVLISPILRPIIQVSGCLIC